MYFCSVLNTAKSLYINANPVSDSEKPFKNRLVKTKLFFFLDFLKKVKVAASQLKLNSLTLALVLGMRKMR